MIVGPPTYRVWERHITKTDFTSGSSVEQNESLIVSEALATNKREGLRLTVRARSLILVLLAILIATRTPWPDAAYYLAFVLALGSGPIDFRRAA